MQGEGSRPRWGLRAGWWHREEAGGLGHRGDSPGSRRTWLARTALTGRAPHLSFPKPSKSDT